nr:MAG TPA: hypothetical protein [Caudoviricetes sp.]
MNGTTCGEKCRNLKGENCKETIIRYLKGE